MPTRKKFAPGQEFGFIGETKSKSKPREVDNTFIEDYWRKRDDSWLNDMFAPQYLKDLIIERRK